MCNFDCLIETGGLLKVTCSHVRYESGNISETMLSRAHELLFRSLEFGDVSRAHEIFFSWNQKVISLARDSNSWERDAVSCASVVLTLKWLNRF